MAAGVQVSIESMAFRGYGVTRVNGQVLFIPYSVRGDTAWIEVIEKKKNYAIGRLKELIEPSRLRTKPPCPYFGVCGGCQWQHIDHPFHGELKRGIFEEILKRLGKMKEIPSIDVIPSPRPYGYRVRVQLKIKGGRVGYHRERSHQVVDIDRCPIAHPLINQIISSLREASLPRLRLEEIEINVSPEQGKGVLILHPLSIDSGIEHFIKEFLQTHPLLKGVAVMEKKGYTLFGDPNLNFTIPLSRQGENTILELRASPGSFFQVNLEQNQALIRTVLEFSSVNGRERVLDLYAGVGNFTLPLAISSQEIWAIEESRAAVEDARFNAEKNGIKNCHFLHGRVEDFLKNWDGEKPDLMILDPPRAGCKTILDQVARLKPRRIVYVSCDPTTFSRDLRLLSDRDYHLRKLSLIDMFPQSYHMEVVGLLTR
ncbi:MAG: 23S rRNA (uracil(1939)-C(5))-methyltransferase RlmD [Thermodesulfobacteriota bacterium]